MIDLVMNYRAGLKAMAAVTAIALACGGLGLLYAHLVRVPFSYQVEARFETLPDDDKALKSWIKEQPGVVPHTVWIGRFGPDKKLLSIMFIQVRNGAGKPPFPNLGAVCKELGYASPDGPLRDATDRGRVYTDP
jgi:hypothetical protein